MEWEASCCMGNYVGIEVPIIMVFIWAEGMSARLLDCHSDIILRATTPYYTALV